MGTPNIDENFDILCCVGVIKESLPGGRGGGGGIPSQGENRIKKTQHH